MRFADEGLQSETFIDLLQYRATHQPEQTAFTFLVDGETQTVSLTYQQLDQQAKAIAIQLQSLADIGDRGVLLYRPGLEFIAAFMGCLYAGVIAVPVNPPRRIEKISKLETILTDAQPRVILTTRALLKGLKGRIQSTADPMQPLWLTTDTLTQSDQQTWQQPSVNPTTLTMLQYTSGSTGVPKGVMVSHNNLLQNAKALHLACGQGADAINVSWLPVFHDMGLMGNILQPLYEGKPSILMMPVAFIQKPIRWLQAISRYRATHSGGPNFAYDLLCRSVTAEQCKTLDLRCWTMAFCGAEPIRAETLKRFSSLFSPCGFRQEAFYPCYGMAEATLLITGKVPTVAPTLKTVDALGLEQNQVRPISAPKSRRTVVGCGQSWLDTQVAIVDPQTLTRVSGETVGEIWVSGSGVAQGYWNQPQETAQTFGAYLADTGEGPFLRTGDLGFLQDQELFITGRLKDMMIFWGLNRYPQFIEQTVENSHPAFCPNGGAAVAIHLEGEERLVLIYEIARHYRQRLVLEAVVETVRWAIARDHFLDLYALVLLKPGSLPKTSSGKIQRQACRIQFLEGSLHSIAEWRSPSGQDSTLIRLMQRYLNPVTHIRRYWTMVKGQALGLYDGFLRS